MGWLSYLPTVIPLVAAGLAALIGYLLADRIGRAMGRRGAMPYQVRAARLIISVLGVAAAGLIIFGSFGAPTLVSGLTFSAILTLAATLALQTTIGNVIAGFILLRNRVLRINDRVSIGGATGRVVQIGLVTVWLRTDDGSLVSVSNSNLLSGPLVNRDAADRLKGEF